MKLVIDIDEELYTYMQSESYDAHLDRRFDYRIRFAVREGKPLPKGHGRLIDADKIVYHRCPDNVLDCPQSYDFTCQHCDFGIATKFRTDAIPTIIEADKDGDMNGNG